MSSPESEPALPKEPPPPPPLPTHPPPAALAPSEPENKPRPTPPAHLAPQAEESQALPAPVPLSTARHGRQTASLTPFRPVTDAEWLSDFVQDEPSHSHGWSITSLRQAAAVCRESHSPHCQCIHTVLYNLGLAPPTRSTHPPLVPTFTPIPIPATAHPPQSSSLVPISSSVDPTAYPSLSQAFSVMPFLASSPDGGPALPTPAGFVDSQGPTPEAVAARVAAPPLSRRSPTGPFAPPPSTLSGPITASAPVPVPLSLPPSLAGRDPSQQITVSSTADPKLSMTVSFADLYAFMASAAAASPSPLVVPPNPVSAPVPAPQTSHALSSSTRTSPVPTPRARVSPIPPPHTAIPIPAAPPTPVAPQALSRSATPRQGPAVPLGPASSTPSSALPSNPPPILRSSTPTLTLHDVALTSLPVPSSLPISLPTSVLQPAAPISISVAAPIASMPAPPVLPAATPTPLPPLPSVAPAAADGLLGDPYSQFLLAAARASAPPVKLPAFSGADPASWLRDAERLLRAASIPMTEYSRRAAAACEGLAVAELRRLDPTLQFTAVSWSQFSEFLTDVFSSDSYVYRHLETLQELRLVLVAFTEVEVYSHAATFGSLVELIHPLLSEPECYRIFLASLPPECRTYLRLHHPAVRQWRQAVNIVVRWSQAQPRPSHVVQSQPTVASVLPVALPLPAQPTLPTLPTQSVPMALLPQAPVASQVTDAGPGYRHYRQHSANRFGRPRSPAWGERRQSDRPFSPGGSDYTRDPRRSLSGPRDEHRDGRGRTSPSWHRRSSPHPGGWHRSPHESRRRYGSPGQSRQSRSPRPDHRVYFDESRSRSPSPSSSRGSGSPASSWSGNSGFRSPSNSRGPYTGPRRPPPMAQSPEPVPQQPTPMDISSLGTR